MKMKIEKEPKKLGFVATPIILLISFPLLCVAVDFVWGNRISFDRWVQYFSSSEANYGAASKTVEDQKFINFHLARLVRGDDRRKLEATGFGCDTALHSIHCVSNRPVRIETTNMTVYIPSDEERDRETTVRPYARQEGDLRHISPVRMIQYSNATEPPPCQYYHHLPAVVFSSGGMGNVFHEMNEMIIPLYITTKQFQRRVIFLMVDYSPPFMTKYGAILSHLSAHEVINPAANGSVHCFPASVVGLKYHDNLALNSSDIPGGYGMSGFRGFLRQALHLKYAHVSEISGLPRPRLLLISRTQTRRFLNEEGMISVMKDVGFEVVVIRRSKLTSNVNKFSQLINSCSVLVGTHGAALTNEIFLPTGAVMIQVELLGTEWPSDIYYGDTARAMGVHYLKYKVQPDETSLVKLYGRNSSVVNDPGSVFRDGGYAAARAIFLDQQNVRLDLARFRATIVEALSIVTDWPAR